MPRIEFDNKGDVVISEIPGQKLPKTLPIDDEYTQSIINDLAEKFGISHEQMVQDIQEDGPIEL